MEISTINETDLYLYHQGTNYYTYRLLGAHCVQQAGVNGVRFAVWAPHAKTVSVVGDFDRWDGRRLPMHRMPMSGIFEIFVPGVQAGASYQYEIKIKGGKIENFQLVVPSTWNLGPRCGNDIMSAVEEALIGTPIADPERPVEILRTIHSFDPCIACAVHVIDGETNEVHKFKVL